MAELMFGIAQMLAVAVIVGGVTIAIWQVWVLANKLCRNQDRASPPAREADMDAADHRARERSTRYR